jgi:PAS domain S-box-containing protein
MYERITEHIESEFVFPNGSVSYFELSIQPVPTGIFILSIDITERKKAEDQIKNLNEELEQKVIERTTQLERKIQLLRESEEKFEKAFQSSAAGISITRLNDSKFLDINEAFIKITGYSKEETLGKSSVELGFIENVDKRGKVLSEIKANGFAKDFELTIRHKSGKLVYVLASVETILIKGEAFALNIIYDISDRKIAEEQLEIVNKELLAFTYSVSHDLRSPLRAISGYAQILLEDYADKLENDGKRILGVIKSNASKMGTLIDDLLTFSRLGRKEVQKMDIDMQILVTSTIDEINKSVPNKAIFQIGTLFPVKADYNLLHQVVINLISNAVKYSSKTENPLIEIYSESNANEISYTIKDNGSGFDMKYKDKLFGVFQRLHSQDQFEGTGVGLAIVQRIIHKHGGKVWAEGEIDKGATFHFSLPI